MRLSRQILLQTVSVLGCAVASWCQLAPSPDAAPTSAAPSPLPAGEPIATFKQDVNLVDLFFTVKDSRGRLVPDLRQQNCSVLDNNIPQIFKTFVAENNAPLNLAVLLDTSVSQSPWLPLEKDAGAQFIQQVLRSRDQAFLLSFDADVDLLQDYTNDPALLMRALNDAQINGGGGPILMVDSGPLSIPKPPIIWRPKVDPGPIPHSNPRGTLLYDAITVAANQKMRQETGRKAMIILTDGDDQGSTLTSHDAVAAAEKNNIPIYVLWTGSPACLMPGRVRQLPAPLPGQPAPSPPPVQRMMDEDAAECDASHYFTPCPGHDVARCISERTGGQIIDVQNSDQLHQAFQQIQDELRSQFVAAYTPSDGKADGLFHMIELQCRQDNGRTLRVQVRKGYYAREDSR